MRLQSAIFDLDGTLVDSMPTWNQVGPEYLRSRGIEPLPGFQQLILTMTLRDGAVYCRAAYGLLESADEIVDGIQAQMEEFYRTQALPKPGVDKFLSLLKMEGVWMYVATNTDRRLVETALRHTGLEGYFRGILTTSDVGIGKNESAEIYERAMTRLRSNKKDTVIFEDALHAIRTAKAAGFRVAGVYDASAEEDQEEIRRISDYYIRSFDEMFDSTFL